MAHAARFGGHRIPRAHGDTRAPSFVAGGDQHAFGQESISPAVEKRGLLPRVAQRAIRAEPRPHHDRRGPDDRAQLASRTSVALAQSPPDSGEAPGHSASPPRLRPRARGVVSLNIGILGTRGVPPRYGGFETFAAELGTRLVGRGHRVTVYCRNVAPALQPAHEPTESRLYDGIDRIVLPAIRHKYFETVSHAFFSVLDAVHNDFDVVLVCNAANAFVLPLLRAARIPTAINVDGIERHRRKWNALGRAVYRLGESMSVVFASRIVADAEVIAQYYREQPTSRRKATPTSCRASASLLATTSSTSAASSRRITRSRSCWHVRSWPAVGRWPRRGGTANGEQRTANRPRWSWSAKASTQKISCASCSGIAATASFFPARFTAPITGRSSAMLLSTFRRRRSAGRTRR
ncbi:MAG: hypothetical protein DMF58_15515 [Acidobacteria bacterium]|nr:MAG: hypothetical protein DMF58_15515 [Acidobacteriota bacterium]